jgi:hypothetical protein
MTKRGEGISDGARDSSRTSWSTTRREEKRREEKRPDGGAFCFGPVFLKTGPKQKWVSFALFYWLELLQIAVKKKRPPVAGGLFFLDMFRWTI